MKERIGYYDIARGLGIIFVVIGHIDTFYVPFRNVVISFHMALFLMVSGMLFFEEKPYFKVISKRFKRVMIPYYMFSLIFVGIEFVRLASQNIYHWPHYENLLIYIFALRGNSVMWFLPALFISEVIFLTLRKTKRDWFTLIAVLGLVLLAIWGNTLEHQGGFFSKELNISLMRGVFCIIFICFGYYWRKFNLSYKWTKVITGGILLAFLIVCIQMNQINPDVDLRAMRWGTAWFSTNSKFILHLYLAILYLVGAISGALSIILLSGLIERYKGTVPLRILSFWGSNSLIIMATHLAWHVLHYSIDMAVWCNKIWPNNFLYHALLLIFVFAVETVLIFVINRFLPVLAGKMK